MEALLAQRRGGLCADTGNSYVTQLKAFGNWLEDGEHLAGNPFRRLKRSKATEDRRHARRELTAEELLRLLSTTRASKRTFRGLTGEARFHLYALAIGTGFRGRSGRHPSRMLRPGAVPRPSSRCRSAPTRAGAARCNPSPPTWPTCSART